MADENGNEGIANFEDGMHWLLPSNVLDEPEAFYEKKAQLTSQKYHHQPKWPHSSTPPAAAAAEPLHHLSGLRSSQPRTQRSRNGTNAKGGFGGPGMRAVFLDSGSQTSCGTGVFLPQRAGTTQFHSSTKPACPPVLLPSRVVQALNLNVHELGQRKQKPHQDCARQKNRGGGRDCNLVNDKKGSTMGAAEWCSPEIFLPNEWTY